MEESSRRRISSLIHSRNFSPIFLHSDFELFALIYPEHHRVSSSSQIKKFHCTTLILLSPREEEIMEMAWLDMMVESHPMFRFYLSASKKEIPFRRDESPPVWSPFISACDAM